MIAPSAKKIINKIKCKNKNIRKFDIPYSPIMFMSKLKSFFIMNI
jgi:hypothetical protein